jgi:hypothetical protein
MIPDLTPKEIRRFYGKLQVSGCGVTWTGPVNNHGYGRFEIYRNGRRVRILAHRLAFKLSVGIDPGRAGLRHGCDTPACCTPDCLLPGTQAENIQDAVERGRLNKTGLLLPVHKRRAAAAQRLDVGAKRCNRCRAVKPIDQFSRDRSSADGHTYECKACVLDRQRERRRLRRSAA